MNASVTQVTSEPRGTPAPCVQVRKQGFPDVVVWTPWVDKAKKMGDFDDEGYKAGILCTF